MKNRIRQIFICLIIVLILFSAITLFFDFDVTHVIKNDHIQHHDGFSYSYNLPKYLQSSLYLDLFDVKVFEDNLCVGPSEASYAPVINVGNGIYYIHENRTIYFSTLNNKPINSHTFTLQCPIRPSPEILLFLLLLSTGIYMGAKRFVKKLLIPVFLIIVSLMLTIIPLEIFLNSEYSRKHIFGCYDGKLPAEYIATKNSLGYRDFEHATENIDERCRIVITGDSLTWGSTVKDDLIYPRVLGKLLGDNFEIINISSPGWATENQLNAFLKDGIRFKPKAVIIGVCLNDPTVPLGEHNGQKGPVAIFSHLPGNLHLWHFLDKKITTILENWGYWYSGAQWENDLYNTDSAVWKRWKKTVNKFSSVLDDHGITKYAVLLITPNEKSIMVNLSNRKHQLLEKVFFEAGYNVLNLYGPYMEYYDDVDPMTLRNTPNDGHPNHIVHNFFSEQIYQWISNDLVELCD